jgi:hypothetical protein
LRTSKRKEFMANAKRPLLKSPNLSFWGSGTTKESHKDRKTGDPLLPQDDKMALRSDLELRSKINECNVGAHRYVRLLGGHTGPL